MRDKFVKFIKQRKIIAIAIVSLVILGSGSVIANSISNNALTTQNNVSTTPTCDGTKITENCKGEDNLLYSQYIYHDAVEEVSEEVYHAAIPEKSHKVEHEAVYGMREVRDCVRTSISYKNGSCALSQCRDGSYSGSSGRGTCSYHGGVARSGGPWYTTTTEQYVITPAWTETVIDEPAKAAWTEHVIITPAREAYYEKVLAE